MMHKIALIFVMGVVLAVATVASTPSPVLFVMGCLILFALSIAIRSEQQG